ncbi:MAG TPA: hypothetical protein VGA36_01200 [Nitriliruptorales bacterium]
MARRRVLVVDVDEAADKNARRRARFAWMQARFGTHLHPPLLAWDWPLRDDDDELSGVERLELVASAYAAAGVPVPIGGFVGSPYLLPGEEGPP